MNSTVAQCADRATVTGEREGIRKQRHMHRFNEQGPLVACEASQEFGGPSPNEHDGHLRTGRSPDTPGQFRTRTPAFRAGDMAICAHSGRWCGVKHPQNTPRPSIPHSTREKKMRIRYNAKQRKLKKTAMCLSPTLQARNSLSIATLASILSKHTARIV
jgi:hypothetical protein